VTAIALKSAQRTAMDRVTGASHRRLSKGMKLKVVAVMRKFLREAAERVKQEDDPAPVDSIPAFAALLRRAKMRWVYAAFAEGSQAGEMAIGRRQKAIIDVGEGGEWNIPPGADSNLRGWLTKTSRREAVRFATTIDTMVNDSLSYIDTETNRGWSPAQVAKALLETGAAKSESYASLIARTATAYASNYGTLDSYRSNGVRVVEWMVTEDDVLCDYCRSMDGVMVEIGRPFFEEGETIELERDDGSVRRMNTTRNVQHPPLHPHCRCTILPVIGAAQPTSVAGGSA